ncbi:ATP-binding protein [Nocardioides kongjuensis]|uniref:histidine kinase n=1 Tax=Nocardioides kongjuensis TaxID=349522 RepID=A0A852RJ22_9ACTN|nr:ATP-binding protein [Nocardioides kongjuensis]NYD31105.1 PAS domain S-box-containing protein [Nocardioides kongjuensis]
MQVDPRAPELVSGDFVAMLDAAHMCVLLHDAETKNILWANPAACELLEFSLEEIRPLKANDMSSSAQQYDRVIGRAWLQDAVERGVSRVEWHYRSRSGRVIPTDALAIRVQLEDRIGVMVQFRDIEREQAVERELRLTTSYVDALAHHTSTLALLLDDSGALRFGTDSALRHIGAPLDEPLGLLTDYVRLRLRGRPASWAEVVEQATPVAPVQLEVHRVGESAVWLEGSVERPRESGDSGLLMILHDVSGRILDEVRRGRELEQENYLARYTAMGDLAMAIAHELGQPLAAARNFLAGVRTHAEALAEPGAGPTTREALSFGLDSTVRQIERAADIVRSLRAFVGHLEHVEQVVDLNDIVTECAYFIGLRAEPAGVAVELDLAPEPVLVRCERVLTGQVVLNLAFNAIDEMAAVAASSEPVTLSTCRRDGAGVAEGLFVVADRGRGLQRDPFAESFTSKEHGSGIGLALSHRIITRQHGTIWSEQREGGGARMCFTLPSVEG